MIVLLNRWYWKGHSLVTWGRLSTCIFSGLSGDRAPESLEFYSEDGLKKAVCYWHLGISQKTELQISNTMEALHIHGSGLLGDSALSQYDSFTPKMVLKGHSLVTWGKTLYIHCSGLSGDKTLSQWDSSQKIILKRSTVIDTGESPRRQSFISVILWKLCTFIVWVSQETELDVNMKLMKF